jgi:hypothetical protein
VHAAAFAPLPFTIKVGFRPFAAIGHHLKMLQRGPSNRTFVHFAAFLLAETSVCRTKCAFAATAPMSAFSSFPKGVLLACIFYAAKFCKQVQSGLSQILL